MATFPVVILLCAVAFVAGILFGAIAQAAYNRWADAQEIKKYKEIEHQRREALDKQYAALSDAQKEEADRLVNELVGKEH